MERVVSKIRKSLSNEIWVVLTDFTGTLRLDLREYFHPGDDGGFHPTKKGISIPLEDIPALRDAIEALAKATELGTVATFLRTGRTEIQAGIRRFQGHTYAELRMFTHGSRDGEESRPTPKGITIQLSLVPILADAIGEAEDLAEDLVETKTG